MSEHQATEPRRLMAVLAHPDDEAFNFGSVLAMYAAEGVYTAVLTATRGERGWQGPPEANPGPHALGRLREQEMAAAVRLLHIGEHHFLDYVDGDLDQADPIEAVGRIVAHLRRVRPQVIVTFDAAGVYGHPDHIAISQFTQAALVAAADSAYRPDLGAPHRTDKLYWMVLSEAEQAAFNQAMGGEMLFPVDGVERRAHGWPDWQVTTVVDARDFWRQGWESTLVHASQSAALAAAFGGLSDEQQAAIWGIARFYRVYSLVNGGRARETDLFAGIATA